MYKIILLFIAISINAQNLLLDKKQIEYNANKTMAFTYTNILVNSTFGSDVSWTKQTGWTISGGTANNSGTAGGQIYQSVATIGEVYKVSFEIKTRTGGAIRIYLGSTLVNGAEYSTINTYQVIGKQATNTNVGIYSSSFNGSIDNVYAYALIAPNGFSTTITDASNYIIEATGGGCEFHEATGQTKIIMNDTLKAGNYRIETLQDWTQGKLYVGCGSDSTALSQGDVADVFKLYCDGVNPVFVSCDNNTISNLKLLSIKK